MSVTLATAGIILIAVFAALAAQYFILSRSERRRKELLSRLNFGAIVLDQNAVCRQVFGDLNRLLEHDPSWSPLEMPLASVISESAVRGDFGPRITDGMVKQCPIGWCNSGW